MSKPAKHVTQISLQSRLPNALPTNKMSNSASSARPSSGLSRQDIPKSVKPTKSSSNASSLKLSKVIPTVKPSSDISTSTSSSNKASTVKSSKTVSPEKQVNVQKKIFSSAKSHATRSQTTKPRPSASTDVSRAAKSNTKPLVVNKVPPSGQTKCPNVQSLSQMKTADILNELKQIFQRLSIRYYPKGTLLVRLRLRKLASALTFPVTSVNDHDTWKDVVASSVFRTHIPAFLMMTSADDEHLFAILQALATIYKMGCQVMLQRNLAASAQMQLLVYRDATRRVHEFGNYADGSKDLLLDFEQLLNSTAFVINNVTDGDDFRKILVYPNANDLLEPPNSLQTNIVDGPYESVDHYLDVQFRLLREDLVGPLRDAIQSSLGSNVGQHKSVIYSNVVVTNPKMENEGVTFELHCNDFKPRRGDTDDERLKNGSLLCLSNDCFKNVFCMAVVVKPLLEQKTRGIVKVIFVEQYVAISRQGWGETFDVVECPSYFLPYRYVLAGLQSLDESSFPFKSYLVDLNSDVKPPRYLKPETTYKLGPLRREVTVLDSSSWPSPKELGLDGAQLQALKSALTKEFAIIQGPPGTGKTFLGLKIVQTLLENDRVWKDGRWENVWSNGRPILIVCFTNHALDQFLEEILNFCPDDVIRVGGRSTCSALNEHNLSVIRQDSSRRTQDIGDLMAERFELYQMLDNIFHEVKILGTHYRRSHRNVLYKQELQRFMLDMHYQQFATFEVNSCDLKYPTIHCWLELLDFEKLQNRGLLQQGWEEAAAHETICAPLKEDVMWRGLHSKDSMTFLEVCAVDNVWNIRLVDRWRLYRFWITLLRADYAQELYSAYRTHAQVYADILDIGCEINALFLSAAKVIGMTTTGVAKNLRMVKLVAPKVVIIEEAAEVLESHILLTITQKCEHVILIGDQQQLRPKYTNYELANSYNFDVSLFERLVNNGMPYDTLTLQHRMRPIISSMLTPHIYKELRNHESVERYEDIRGVASNLFFVDHRQPESKLGGQSTSHSNDHEARFIGALCKYLVNQGYEPKRITVLTTYRSQLNLLNNTMTSCGLTKVQCQVVDSFQGEENDIILLSLVRSNRHGLIGFVDNSNRMCVALSRARMGFFCIGNFELLTSRDGIWLPVVRYLNDVNCIAPSMKLVCPNHPMTITEVATSNDFSRVPEGGCQLECDTTLPCGHQCSLICHGYDRDHLHYECMEPCTRQCAREAHDCVKPCWMKCEPCLIDFPRVYPNCGHETTLKCCVDLSEVRCSAIVAKLYPDCGHTVEIPCHANLSDVPCRVEVTKVHPDCGHENVLPCFQGAYRFNCHTPCSEQLACGHPCPMGCRIDCSTADCKLACNRVLSCGHPCKGVCGKSPCEPCEDACEKTLQCGHPCRMKCYEVCNDNDCQVLNSVQSPCGHKVTVPCLKSNSVIDLLRFCMSPCLNELQCGHLCAGSCGDCAQGRNHVKCRVGGERLLVCGHRFTSPCFLETNTMECSAPCINICGHGDRCRYPCSWQCMQCNRKCVWRCQHFVCTRKCYEVCDRPPCDVDCPLQLPCGHPCVGLCGEACPPLCKICDAQPEVFFGTEDDVDARFVLLQDCGHIFEVKSLDKWMGLNEANNDVDHYFAAKRCPKCNVLVSRASRYNSVIKKFLQELCIVKGIVWKNRNYVMDRFADMLDQWKSCRMLEKIKRKLRCLRGAGFDGERIKPVKKADVEMRQLLIDIRRLAAKSFEMRSVDEKLERLERCFGRQRVPTVLETADFYREFLRIWYLVIVVESVGHRWTAAGDVAYRRVIELLTSTHQFTLLMENDVRQLLPIIRCTIPKPKPMKQFVGWRRNWFRCAKCNQVYCRSGFVNVVEDIGCSMCNSDVDQVQ